MRRKYVFTGKIIIFLGPYLLSFTETAICILRYIISLRYIVHSSCPELCLVMDYCRITVNAIVCCGARETYFDPCSKICGSRRFCVFCVPWLQDGDFKFVTIRVFLGRIVRWVWRSLNYVYFWTTEQWHWTPIKWKFALIVLIFVN
jgi:hypothetical protein